MSLLSGCAELGQAGRSNVAGELLRIKGEKGVALISWTPVRAVFAVRGERVVVAPPDGYCVDEKSIDVTRRAAFALIADCLTDPGAAAGQTDGKGNVVAISLPRSFPGILTVSISAELAIKPGDAGLDGFADALAGPSGRVLLARGNGDATRRVVDLQQMGGAVYVLAEETPDGLTILAPRFWRAFTTISGRLVMVTVSSFSDRPVGEQAMQSFLARAMAALRKANGSGANADETRVAGGLEASLASLPSSGAEAGAEEVAVLETGSAITLWDGTDPSDSPLPPKRRRSSGGAAVARAAIPTVPAPRPSETAAAIAIIATAPTATVAVSLENVATQAPTIAPKAPAKPK